MTTMTQACQSAVETIAGEIAKHQRFLICGHVRPDGDCLGSMLAMHYFLKQIGKEVVSYNKGPILENYDFLPGIGEVQLKYPREFDPQVTLFLDCGSPERVDDHFSPPGLIINIDHHMTNARFGKINYIDEEASAVGEQVYSLIRHMGGTITKDIATLLYMSLMADTGSFRYSNTKAHTFQVAADLVEMGVSPSMVSQTYYENQTPGAIKLTGKVLASLHLEDGGSWIWSEISQADYKEVGGEQNEPEGLVSTMRGIRGVEVSALMHEVPEGGLRVGIRSKGNVDVSAIAKDLGGGGHHNASGAYMRGNYAEQKKKVLDALAAHMDRFRKS